MGRSVLQDELKKKNPFDAPEQETALNLARTAERLQAEFSRLFKAHGITGSQYNVLRILRGAGAELPCLEIAGRMITHLPDITRLVDRLEAAGLVARVAVPGDRRSLHVQLTEAGHAVVPEARRVVRASVEQHFARRLSEEELGVIKDAHARLARPAGNAEQTPVAAAAGDAPAA